MLLKLTAEQLRENRINLLSQKESMKSVTAELTLSRKTVLVSEIAERNFVERSTPQEQNTPKNSAVQATGTATTATSFPGSLSASLADKGGRGERPWERGCWNRPRIPSKQNQE